MKAHSGVKEFQIQQKVFCFILIEEPKLFCSLLKLGGIVLVVLFPESYGIINLKRDDYTPANFVCGRVYCFHVVRMSVRPSVRPCVRNVLFL